MAENNRSTQQFSDMADQASDMAQDAKQRVSETADRVGSKVKEMGRQVQSNLRDVDFSEATIPDAFRKVPKTISPRVHSWLDLAVTVYFVAIGTWFASRRKAGAATAAFVNAGMVAGVSLMTDYKGDGSKPLSFKMHGTMDAVQATTAAMAPLLHGFADEPEAKYFWGQATNEVAVIASTDWDAGMPAGERRRAA